MRRAGSVVKIWISRKNLKKENSTAKLILKAEKILGETQIDKNIYVTDYGRYFGLQNKPSTGATICRTIHQVKPG